MKQARSILMAAASAAALFVLSGPLALAGPIGPNLVVNGGFETGDVSGWTQSGDTSLNGVDCSAGCFYFAGSLDFSSLSQQIATLPGSSYNIHLLLQVEDSGGVPAISAPNAFQ